MVLGIFYATGVPRLSEAGKYATIVFIELFAVSFTSSWSIVTRLCVPAYPWIRAYADSHPPGMLPRSSPPARALLQPLSAKAPISSQSASHSAPNSHADELTLCLAALLCAHLLRSNGNLICCKPTLLTFAVLPGCCLGSGLPRPKLVLALLLLRRLHRHRRRLRIPVHARRCGRSLSHPERPRSHGLRRAAVRGQTLERYVSCTTCRGETPKVLTASPGAASTQPSKAPPLPSLSPRSSAPRASPKCASARTAGRIRPPCPARRAPTSASTSRWTRSARRGTSPPWTTRRQDTLSPPRLSACRPTL